MSLDAQGVLAAVTLAIYLPVFFFAVRIALKYKRHGWILLVLFTLIRIVGGSLLVAAEEIRPAVTGLYIGGYALEASGLSPLLLCTLALLHITTQTQEGNEKYGLLFRVVHVMGLVALTLTIIGITETSASSQSTSETMRRVGVILFAVLFIILVAVTIFQWVHRRQIMRYRKQLLLAVSIALPFLAIRTLYSILSTFSSSGFLTTTGTSSSSDSGLAKFNMFTGEWQIYLGMDMIMEYVTVLIFVFAGTTLKLDQDYKLQEYDEHPLYQQGY